ncbi:GFA family protein [Aeromonas veronii]
MKGGCHCGAIRYEVLTAPFAADFCHCRDCQRTTGAPVGAWMDFYAEQVQWLCGKPTEYASSDFIRRGFCAECGSTLTYRSTQYPDYLTLAIASLDNPEAVAPTYHIHTDSQLPWLLIQDEHPRYRKGK